MTNMTQPPAGWYPSPRANEQLQYWNGSRWLDRTTEHDEVVKRVMGGVVSPDGSAKRAAARRWWLWALAAAGVLLLATFITIAVVDAAARQAHLGSAPTKPLGAFATTLNEWRSCEDPHPWQL